MIQGSERLGLLRDMALSIVASVAFAILLVWLIDGTFPTVFPEFTEADPQHAFPLVRVAILTALVVVTSPHLTRPVRRFGC